MPFCNVHQRSLSITHFTDGHINKQLCLFCFGSAWRKDTRLHSSFCSVGKINTWDEATEPLDIHQLLFSFALACDQASTSRWATLFGQGHSPRIMPYFSASLSSLRPGASPGQPFSTEKAVTRVGWEVFCPGLTLSHWLQPTSSLMNSDHFLGCWLGGNAPMGLGAQPLLWGVLCK